MTKNRLESRLERLASAPSIKAPHEARTISPPARQQREQRLPAFKFGVVSFAGGQRANCMVLDLSKKGARISLEGAVNLPDVVRLSIPQHSVKVDATVRWQRGAEAGLLFDGG